MNSLVFCVLAFVPAAIFVCFRIACHKKADPEPQRIEPVPAPEGFDFGIGSRVLVRITDWHPGMVVGHTKDRYVIRMNRTGNSYSFVKDEVIAHVI